MVRKALLASIVMAFVAIPASASAASGCSSSAGTTISDCGFETPALQTGQWEYGWGSPSAINAAPGQLGSWNTTSYAGISNNFTPFTGATPAPEGSQVGFVQSYAGSPGIPAGNGSLSQSISGWQGGVAYVLTVSIAARPGNIENFHVLLDNQIIGTATADNNASYTDVSFPFSTTAGTHTLTFQGLDPTTADDTALLDNLRLTGSRPSPQTTAACKNGGWQSLADRNGTPFKNQGDCVSYVATGGRNTANG